jgi:hypothetical protein
VAAKAVIAIGTTTALAATLDGLQKQQPFDVYYPHTLEELEEVLVSNPRSLLVIHLQPVETAVSISRKWKPGAVLALARRYRCSVILTGRHVELSSQQEEVLKKYRLAIRYAAYTSGGALTYCVFREVCPMPLGKRIWVRLPTCTQRFLWKHWLRHRTRPVVSAKTSSATSRPQSFEWSPVTSSLV